MSVQLAAVHKAFAATTVLSGFDLDAPSGAITALVGPSGCGKTTALRLVAGLERPDGGVVRLAGRVLADDSTWVPPEDRQLGMVFQGYALWPHLRVLDQLLWPLTLRGVAPADAQRRAREALDRIELGALADRHPHQLSGGQQQRVALARALVARPQALLLDEPLSALDARIRGALASDIRRQTLAEGLTALLVTHDPAEALATADHIALLDRGRVIEWGPPAQFASAPHTRAGALAFSDLTLVDLPIDAGQVRLDGTTPSCHAVRGAPEDGRVSVGLRPDWVELGSEGPPARVVLAVPTPLGWRITLDTAWGTVVAQHPTPMAPGTATRWILTRAWVLGPAG